MANRDIIKKINYRTANSVDSDEMAHYEPSRLDLHCLQKYLFWSAGLKGLIDYSVYVTLNGRYPGKQKIQIICHILWYLIRVYTVCIRPFVGMQTSVG